MSRWQRAGGFALVPLSVLPLVAAAPIVAPSVTQRIQELRGTTRSVQLAGDRVDASQLLVVAPLVTKTRRSGVREPTRGAHDRARQHHRRARPHPTRSSG